MNNENVNTSKNDGNTTYGKGIFLNFPISRAAFKIKTRTEWKRKKKDFITSKLERKGKKKNKNKKPHHTHAIPVQSQTRRVHRIGYI